MSSKEITLSVYHIKAVAYLGKLVLSSFVL